VRYFGSKTPSARQDSENPSGFLKTGNLEQIATASGALAEALQNRMALLPEQIAGEPVALPQVIERRVDEAARSPVWRNPAINRSKTLIWSADRPSLLNLL
jgi:hypothetical protein